MEISLDKIISRSDPYQLFIDSIRSPETLRRYKTHPHSFLKLIPNQVYIDSLGKTPKNREAPTLDKLFVELSRKNMDLASDVLLHLSKKTRNELLQVRLAPKLFLQKIE